MELKPCPFCGCTEVFIEDDDWGWVSYCEICDANISGCMTKEEAVIKWNKRIDI